jgi:hypothetical protein
LLFNDIGSFTQKKFVKILDKNSKSVILVKEVTDGDLTTIELENVPDEPSQRYFQQPAAKGIRQQMAENAEEQLVFSHLI